MLSIPTMLFRTIRLFLRCYFVISLVCPPAFAGEYLPVKTMPIEKTSVHPVITAFGSLEKKPQTLYFETGGRLTKLSAEEGQVVKKGQLLAQLDTILIDNQNARAKLDLQYTKTKLTRATKIKKMITQEGFEDLEYNYSSKLLELKEIEKELKKYFLYAPATGKILKRFLDFAGAVDSTTPIFMMKSFKQPWLVTAYLTEQEVNAIKKDDKANVHFNAFPKKVFTGRMQKIADSL